MDIVIDTLKDTFLIFPILFIMYYCLEYFEHKTEKKDYSHYLLKYGPLFGAIVGVVPQCGFGVLASMLFIESKISLGTLISVFIATSDEAIPILITNPDFYPSMFGILALKFVLAIVIGYLVDFLFKKGIPMNVKQPHVHEHEHSMVIEALLRTIKIYAVIFIINFILSTIIEWITPEQLSILLLTNSMIQPIATAIFGFLPNCAASVIMTQLFMNQSLSFAALISGLITNAGLGILVLIQNKVKTSIILRICLILFLSALVISLPLQWFYLH